MKSKKNCARSNRQRFAEVNISNPRTLMLLCPTCEDDRGEPIGVTGRFDDSVNDVVAIRCPSCSTVYLTPGGTADSLQSRALPQAGRLMRRRIRRWIRGIEPGARILCIDADRIGRSFLDGLSREAGGDRIVEAREEGRERVDESGSVRDSGTNYAQDSRRYDLIFLASTLESHDRPGALLSRMASLLTERGQIVVIAYNVGSCCFACFGGRHWSGYQSGVRQCFEAKALQALGDSAGLHLEEVRSLFAADVWPISLGNWFRDWGMPEAAARALAGNWFGPRLVGAACESFAVMRGRGSLLSATLRIRAS